MNAKVIMGAVIVALGVAGYVYYGKKNEAPAPAATTTTAPAATTTTTAPAATTTEPAATTTAATAPAANDAADMIKNLTTANFDAAKINEMIEKSSLDAATKATLKTAVDSVAQNPAAAQGVIDQLKAAIK